MLLPSDLQFITQGQWFTQYAPNVVTADSDDVKKKSEKVRSENKEDGINISWDDPKLKKKEKKKDINRRGGRSISVLFIYMEFKMIVCNVKL